MPLKSVSVVLDTTPGAVAFNLTVIPARLSVVFFPVAAVTFPVMEADVPGPAVPACCANPGTTQIAATISIAPQNAYKLPPLPLRHNFNDTLHFRTETRRHSKVIRADPFVVRAAILPGVLYCLSCCCDSLRQAAVIRSE